MHIINATSTPQNIVQNAQSLVDNVVNRFVVRPKNGIGISGFQFDVLADEEISLSSDITDHYTEDNNAIQDHIALRPVRFTLRGYVSEITSTTAMQSSQLLANIQTLVSLGGFLPQFSYQATVIYAKAAGLFAQATQVVNQAENFFNLFTNVNTTSNKQQEAYNYFVSMRDSRQLCQVETPWRVYENMAIEDIRVLSPENSRFVSDFSVTFKQLRFITTTVIQATINNPLGSGLLTALTTPQVGSGRAQSMLSVPTDLGSTGGQATNNNGDPVSVGTLASYYNTQTAYNGVG